MKLVKARFGLVGTGCIIELFKTIYSEGYALKWDDDTRLLFSAENAIDADTLQSIISFAVLKGVFHAGKLDKLGILTSSGIQKRWLKVAKDSNRTIRDIEPSMSLLDSNGLSAQETELSAQEMQPIEGLSGTENTHIIVKDIREEREYRACASSLSSDSPEEKEAPALVPQEIPKYPEMVFAEWAALGDKVFQPAGLVQFLQTWSRDIAPFVRGVHSDDVLAAIRNLGVIVAAPKGTYYWKFRIGIAGFLSKHLEKFLPKNFNVEDFAPTLSFKGQEEAETAAAIEKVFGKGAAH